MCSWRSCCSAAGSSGRSSAAASPPDPDRGSASAAPPRIGEAPRHDHRGTLVDVGDLAWEALGGLYALGVPRYRRVASHRCRASPQRMARHVAVMPASSDIRPDCDAPPLRLKVLDGDRGGGGRRRSGASAEPPLGRGALPPNRRQRSGAPSSRLCLGRARSGVAVGEQLAGRCRATEQEALPQRDAELDERGSLVLRLDAFCAGARVCEAARTVAGTPIAVKLGAPAEPDSGGRRANARGDISATSATSATPIVVPPSSAGIRQA